MKKKVSKASEVNGNQRQVKAVNETQKDATKGNQRKPEKFTNDYTK